jgi:hypothetical protein
MSSNVKTKVRLRSTGTTWLSNAFEPTNWLMLSLRDQSHHLAKLPLKCKEVISNLTTHLSAMRKRGRTPYKTLWYISLTFLS